MVIVVVSMLVNDVVGNLLVTITVGILACIAVVVSVCSWDDMMQGTCAVVVMDSGLDAGLLGGEHHWTLGFSRVASSRWSERQDSRRSGHRQTPGFLAHTQSSHGGTDLKVM